MMYKYLFFLLLLLPLSGLAQFTISGKVISYTYKKPVVAATVFLNSTTGGTITADDGVFTLANVKAGQYDLVVSCVGYETYYKNLTVNNALIASPVIELLTKTTQLKEVRVKAPDANRANYLELFLKDFLGSTANAAQCKLLNPEALDLNYDRNKNTLMASSDDYLVLENNALGYKIYYQLNNYQKNFSSRLLYYDGPVRFEEMLGKASQQKRWAKNRLLAYNGSSMHFLRSVYEDRFKQEGFNVLRLKRIPNPARPPDSIIRAALRKYTVRSDKHPEWRDSANYYSEKLRLPKNLEYLYKAPLTIYDFVIPATNDMKALRYKDFLYVVYMNSIVHKSDGSEDNPTTVLTLNTAQALFDHNGILVDPNGIISDGAWGKNGAADMLPIDYIP